MVDISVQADIKEATRYLFNVEKRIIPRATNRAINKTAVTVKTKIQRHISQETGLTIGMVKAGIRLIKSNFSTLQAQRLGKGRAKNLLRFVTPGKRSPGAFSNQPGVKANAWREPKVYRGAFIIYGATHGKPIVVARTGKARNKLKGLPGPSIRKEFARQEALNLMDATTKERFRIEFERALTYYLERLPK